MNAGIIKTVFMNGLAITGLTIPAAVGAADVYLEIHCKHFFYGCPAGTPATI